MGNKMENPNLLTRIPSLHHTGQGSVLQVIVVPVVGAIWEFPGYPNVTSVSIVRKKKPPINDFRLKHINSSSRAALQGSLRDGVKLSVGKIKPQHNI